MDSKKQMKINYIKSKLDFKNIIYEIPFVVSSICETACWMHKISKKTNEESFEIHINPDFMETLETDDNIIMVLIHEIFHHIYFRSIPNLYAANPSIPFLINVSLDVGISHSINNIEKYKSKQTNLYRKMEKITTSLKQKPTLIDEICFLPHPELDIEFCSKQVEEIWEFIWLNETTIMPQTILQYLMNIFGNNQIIMNMNLRYNPIVETDDAIYYKRGTKQRGLENIPDIRSIFSKIPKNFSPIRDKLRLVNKFDSDLIDPNNIKGFKNWLSNIKNSVFNKKFVCKIMNNRNNEKNYSFFPVKYKYSEFKKIYISSRCDYSYPFRYDKLHNQDCNSLIFYIDVSFSMKSHYPYVIAVLKSIEKLLPSKIFIFNTEVIEKELKIKDIILKLFEGGGTSFDAVFQHFFNFNKYNNLLIFTDGQDFVSNSNIKKIKKNNVNVSVVLFAEKYFYNEVNDYCGLKEWANNIFNFYY